ncbi:isochorismatase family protein [Spirillospora sp. NPDC049652]
MNTALIVIDVQESFRQLPDWGHISQPDIVSQVNRLVEAAREREQLVVWVLSARHGSGTVFDPALGHVRLMDGVRPRDDEPVLTKSAHNAFTTTNLQQRLTALGVRKLTISGIRTEQCCETTARLASDLGYEVDFAIDATATSPIPHPDTPDDVPYAELLDDPRTLGIDDILTRTHYALSGRFATIRTVDELTA